MDLDRKDDVIDWSSDQNRFLMNPKLDSVARAQAERMQAVALGEVFLPGFRSLSGHLWIQSSGSSTKPDESAKWIALSKKAFVAAAEGSNRHLQVIPADVWGLALPLFHVGGLSILVRSMLAGSKVARWEGAWTAAEFDLWLREQKVTLLSLVPTQLYDLVQLKRPAPPHLRAIVLGGARVEAHLYAAARRLGWPVLPSFGMTEMCSQVATASLSSLTPSTAAPIELPALELLPHIEARSDESGHLGLRGPSLYSGFLQERRGAIFWDPPVLKDGFWFSADRAEVRNRQILPLGRATEFIKIKGEGLDLSELRSRFEAWIVKQGSRLSPNELAIVALPDNRDGHRLILASEGEPAEPLAQQWNRECFPIERLESRSSGPFPRSELGKILWEKLKRQIT